MCANFRRTARALTQLYDEALRPFGLRVTQFTLLQFLALAGEVSQGQLGEMLAIDSTTLTRTLKTMSHNNWIAVRRGTDRRERRLRLSPRGSEKLQRATPAWEKTQTALRRRLGDQTWNDLSKLTRKVTSTIAAGRPLV